MSAGLHIPGDRVYLRPVAIAEAQAILDGRLPPHLRFAEGYPSEFAIEVMEIFAGARRADATGFAPMFIVRKDDGAIIGHTGGSIPDGPASPVVGYDVIEALWGQGYATDALRALIAHFFGQPGIGSVRADTLKTHSASRRVMEKAGMSLVSEGVEEVDGVSEEIVYYEVWRAVET